MGETRKKQIKIEVGTDHSIIIDKMFGPTIFADIKIELDNEGDKCDWVVYRKCATGNVTYEWREAARIPGQVEEDFKEWGHD